MYTGQNKVTGLECRRTAQGREYRGVLSVTRSGTPCQRWDMQSPHLHANDNPAFFDEVLISDAWNYCRNPDGDVEPWCYPTDPLTRYEFCDIPMCGESELTLFWLQTIHMDRNN